jgi:hypothetical protein
MQAGANSFGRVSETRQLSENDQVNARHQVYQLSALLIGSKC